MAEENSEGFLRQRRNLIAICAAVSIVELAQVNLKDLSLSGARLYVGRPEVLHHALWIALAYWLIRYWQYFTDHPASEITKRYNHRIDYTASLRARDKYFTKHQYKELFPRESEPEKLNVMPVPDRVERMPTFWRAEVLVSAASPTSAYSNQSIGKWTFEGWEYRWLKIKAWLYISWRHKVFTEYYFPIYFAVTTAYGIAFVSLSHVSISAFFG